MSLRLLVHREGESPREHVFDEYTVVVGRGADADLTLEDPGRVISKRHAEIRRTGTAVKARDLGSKNGTRLGGHRLDTDSFSPIQTGEKLEVGDVLIELLPELKPAPSGGDLERTMFARDFVNPFAEPANAIADALGTIRREMGEDASRQTLEALDEAVRDAFGLGEDGAVAAVVALARGETPSVPDTSSPPARALEAPAFPAPPVVPTPVPAPEPDAHRAALPPPAGSLEGLAAALAPLLALPTQFRHEFIGETVMHAPETAFLYEADAAALAAYVAEVDGAEREERLERLQAAAREVVAHQLGLVEGYRAATQSGIDAFLNRLDPDSLEVEAAEGGLARFLPASKKDALREALADRIEELRQDGAATERRIFRPAFIRAYLALTSAARVGSGLQRQTLPDSGLNRPR